MLGNLLAGRYQVLQILGGGGFGQTYIALDIQRPGSPRCVVKQFRPVTHNPEFLETARRLFTSEAETLEQLGYHEQIPRLLAYFEEHQEFFLVQEYIEGHSLRAEMISGQKWTEDRVIFLLQQLLNILKFIHHHKVIHRDIKPENIIRRLHDSNLVLIDFGAVKQVHTQMITSPGQTQMTVAIGTPGYMSIEQGRGKPHSNSDIYSLGVVCIQALTGLHPREFEEDPHTGEILWQHRATVNPALAAIISKMVLNNFKQRYQSATQVLEALEQNVCPEIKTQLFQTPSLLTSQPPISVSEQQATSNQTGSILPPAKSDRLEKMLLELVGPVATTLLRRAASAPNYQELIDNLSLHLPENQRLGFQQQAMLLLQEESPSQSETSLQPSPSITPPTINSTISDSFIRECERELVNIIGPMGVFLVQKAIKSTNGQISRPEFVKTLAADIPEPQKALQFQQKFLT
ncbi:protein kinase family protein [Nostoc sp. PCC 7524]|uniref:serine/threonine-protein kinase n=1 Tax=Nostoc sp. (strain ATCC 29411 / PCC 7524) TaxID=28072 RepID=UPI00029F4A25|nr:serine/threonine-protein kinase [Nostoc sp. PCC 7524]AFY47913.1 protein kinase family protein [Nostoc sp. PCC 7524]